MRESGRQETEVHQSGGLPVDAPAYESRADGSFPTDACALGSQTTRRARHLRVPQSPSPYPPRFSNPHQRHARNGDNVRGNYELNAEDRRFHFAQAVDVAAHARGGVVEQEGLGQAHDRVGERGGLDGRLVGRRRAPPSSISSATRATMCGCTTPAPEVMIRSAASRSCSTNWRSAGASARLRLKRSNASSSAAPPRPRALRARASSSGSAAAFSTSPIRPSRDPNQR